MGTSYDVKVVVELIFQPGLTLLKSGDRTFDLSKLDNIDEFRVLLYAIATEALSGIVSNPVSPVATPPNPTSASESLAAMADSFRKQAEQARQRLREETASYEAAIAGITGGKSV